MAYNGTVEVISGLKQKNNGTFPLVHASAVQVDDDDTRLDELLEGMDSNIKQSIDDLIMVQNTQPTSEYNEVWIKSTSNEVQVPTYEEFEELVENTVYVNEEQTLTDAQKQVARQNIGATDGSNSVHINDTQNLSEAQKAQARGNIDVASVGELSDLKSVITFDEHLINNGTYTIKASDLESGQWGYSTKTDNDARARTKNLLPVRAGMTITYSNTTFDTYFGVLETPTSNTYIQTLGWKTDGSGTINITNDGWLTFIIRNHIDTSATVNSADYNSNVKIMTETNSHIAYLEENSASSRSELISELLNANAFDIVQMCKPVNFTHRGVTFTWNDKYECFVSGTASGGLAVCSFYHNLNGFPTGMKSGGTYRIKYSSTNVRLEMIGNKNGAYDSYLCGTLADCTITIPDDITGITIRLAVLDGTAVNEIVRPIILTEALTNDEITEMLAPSYKKSKKYVAFGDSLIWGAVWSPTQGTALHQVKKEWQIPSRIALAIGAVDNYKNEAVGGSGYLAKINNKSIVDTIKGYDLTDVDIITVMAGPNDYGQKLGAWESATIHDGTICGAVLEIIDHVKTNYPKCQIIFIQSTPYGPGEDVWNYRSVGNWSINDFEQNISEICKENNVGYISWHGCTYIDSWKILNVGWNIDVGPNHSHLVADADYVLLGDYIAGKIVGATYGNEYTKENEFLEFNTYDVLKGRMIRASNTSNGITYTWDGDVCTVNGTSTSASANVLMPQYYDLPEEIQPEKEYSLIYNSTNANVRLRIMFKDSSDTNLETLYASESTSIVIPTDAAKWTMALYVLSGKTITNATVSGIKLLTAKTNAELTDLLNNNRSYQTYTPKTLSFYNIPENAASFDAKTMTGNSYTRGYYSVLSETFTGTNPPDILTSLSPTTYITIEKHLLNPYGNLYYLDIICQLPAFHLKMFNEAGGIHYNWLMAERKRIYVSNTDANKFINLDTEYLYFRKSLQTLNSNYYHSMLLPVKKGDSVYLHSKVGTSGLVFAKIKYNYIVDYVYRDSKEYDGLITFDYDGFLAFNIENASMSVFYCYIETGKSQQDIIWNSRFENALSVRDNVLPEYDDNNVCRVLQRGATWMGAIHHWGIIGASFDSGEFNWTNPNRSDHVSEIDWYEYSCWKYLQRINGIPDMYCYSDGGQNARDWIKLTHDPEHPENTHPRAFAYDSDTEQAVPYWPYRSGIGHEGGCWWKMYSDYQNGNVKQAFVLNLGGNDINNENPHDDNWNEYAEGQYDPTKKYKCGTTADVGTYDLATNTDTLPTGRTGADTAIPGIVNSFAGYMGAIMNRLIAIQPDCVIFLCTIHNMYSDIQKRMEIWNQYNELIKELAEMPQYKDHVFILDAAEYGPNFSSYPQYSFWNYYHPNAMGYVYMAWTWNTMIDYIMQKNLLSFKQSMFIGTGKKYTPIE